MTTPGNHELWWNFTAYQARCGMSMPSAGPNALSGAMYYTLTVGPHEFVFMNSETWIDTGDLDAAQIAWFLNYTNTIDRSQHPLLTVTHHRPLYCCECRDILRISSAAKGSLPSMRPRSLSISLAICTTTNVPTQSTRMRSSTRRSTTHKPQSTC